MIDLHLHTTASDGRLAPAALVERVRQAGVRTMSVTDHDTVAALDEVTACAAAHDIRVVPGIEITAVHDRRDVHVLGYFFDHRSPRLAAFLESQRSLRVTRVIEIGARLSRLGVPIDVEALLRSAASRPGTSVGRPVIARALVAAGHAGTVQDAFDRYLAEGQSAYVPRTGRSPEQVVDAIHDAGGIASFAHPGVTRKDDVLPGLAARGLDAIEVYHSDHSADDVARYRTLAARLGLAVSGGSDFHGEAAGVNANGGRRRDMLGEIALPEEAFVRLAALAAARQGGA